MDEFLAAVGVQAMKYAIRSGIALTSTYALGQCSRLLKTVDDKKLYGELSRLQKLLDGKMRVITPAIDLIEFKSGRGNVFLESAVPLTKSLHQDINSLGRRIASAVSSDESLADADRIAQQRGKLCDVISEIRGLLDRIDHEIPLLQLAITASGESLSVSLPSAISPSRLLQASTLLILGDTQYARDPTASAQVGPAFNLSVYMLFLGHASKRAEYTHQTTSPVYGLQQGEKKPMWQEVIHKARVRLCRSPQPQEPEDPLNDPDVSGERLEFSYYLEILEDLDDGRVHDDHEAGPPNGQISRTGILETIPAYQLSKIFYTDTGRILNIGRGDDGENSPVLLLKRDLMAARPFRARTGTRDADNVAREEAKASSTAKDDEAEVDQQLREESAQVEAAFKYSQHGSSRLPKQYDPEWIALGLYEEQDAGPDDSETEDESLSGSEDEVHERPKPVGQGAMLDSMLAAQVRNLGLSSSPDKGEARSGTESPPKTQTPRAHEPRTDDFVARSPFNAITSSLSLIEMLIRLAGLQEFQQTCHLSIPDHVLTFFLEETSTTAGGFWARGGLKMPPGYELTAKQIEKASSVYEHVSGASLRYSRFVSTSLDPRVALGFAGECHRYGCSMWTGYLYKIAADWKMVDVSGTLLDQYQSKNQREQAVVGGVPFEQVMGWYDLSKLGHEWGTYTRSVMNLLEQNQTLDGYTANPLFNPRYLGTRGAGGKPQLAGFSRRDQNWRKEPWKQFAGSSATEALRKYVRENLDHRNDEISYWHWAFPSTSSRNTTGKKTSGQPPSDKRLGPGRGCDVDGGWGCKIL
ncbi:putative enterotoxin [Ophiocordyceps camponoti-rufipedis]|uniref:Putative enterotoxin n=1 Tax=Ophiocordyceps camponoti-rufipedis TaxID=2004952 RepID=A0A2C5ZLS8_9HYPO|nr:putative enterotoxin [Ophiocordyceps camponoti-rufipedis]